MQSNEKVKLPMMWLGVALLLTFVRAFALVGGRTVCIGLSVLIRYAREREQPSASHIRSAMSAGICNCKLAVLQTAHRLGCIIKSCDSMTTMTMRTSSNTSLVLWSYGLTTQPTLR